MANIHHKATRFVSILLIPAALAVAGTATWALQPPVIAASGAVEIARLVPTLTATPRPDPLVTVGEITVVKPLIVRVPAKTTAPKPKVQHCEYYPLYASQTEKVRICEWL